MGRAAQLTVILMGALLCFQQSLPSLEGGALNISVAVRWCGIAGALSMETPGSVGEGTSDDVLWRRHERPSDQVYIPLASLTFRSAAPAEIMSGPESFPIIRDTSGTGGNVSGTDEARDAVNQCRRAWRVGDPLYYDANNTGILDAVDTLLSSDPLTLGFLELGHAGAAVVTAPPSIKFVDGDGDEIFELGEHLYRDENGDGAVSVGDTLLSPTLGTLPGYIDPDDMLRVLLNVPSSVKYLDLIRQPPSTYNIGHPGVEGITAVSVNDFEVPGLGFPVHGVAPLGICGEAALMDDPSQYLPPGPDYGLFETQLVGHEFGHALCLRHGDGVDDDGDGSLDDGDDPAAPFAGAGQGTLCDSNNLMQYCWQDNGTSGAPAMNWIGVGASTAGTLTTAQSNAVRNQALTISDTTIDPVSQPSRASRQDVIGDVPSGSAHVDIADMGVIIDRWRANTEFFLTTRRPFPRGRRLIFHFLVDADDDRLTGGAAAALSIPSEFKGGELVVTVAVDTSKPRAAEVAAFRFDREKRDFTRLEHRSIAGSWTTLGAVVNYPGPTVRVAERVSARMPNAVRGPFARTFRVEYISRDLASGVTDRAQTRGMIFAVPVFPECRTEPEVVPMGGRTTVLASRLLRTRDVHVLLGDREVATGRSDARGSAVIRFTIPPRTRPGKHLVTIGALAVTGDCFVTVRRQ